MNEQKFQVGDRVRVRPFDQIDLDDIGVIDHTVRDCYGISAATIGKWAERGGMKVEKVSKYKGAYVYYLDAGVFWWAQGMLRPAEEDLPEPDCTGLFALLASV